MQTRHGLVLLTLTALACGGADPQTTDADSTSGADSTGETGAPGSTGAEPTDTGAADTGTADAGTSGSSDTGGEASTGGSTGPGESSGGETGDTGETGETTGTAECEPIWAVPEVPADVLAAHDLAWIGCGFTACDPGEPGVVCAPFDLAGVPLEYLGHIELDDAQVFTTDDVIAPDTFGWLDGPRHVYRHDEVFYIATEGDEARDQLDVYFAVRALELLRTDHPNVYETVVAEALELPADPPLDGYGWKNRLRGVIVSFDTSPLYIAAGLTILDGLPVPNMMTDLDEYSNVAAISIDSETILGSSDEVGSRPIYGAATDDENYLRYLREGLVETVVHEMLHTRVDRRNSVDANMSMLWNRRGEPNACAKWELEEALVAATSLLHFREGEAVSAEYLDYYDVVLDANLAIVEACPDYAMWAQAFALPSGVDPRYDLRLVDLE